MLCGSVLNSECVRLSSWKENGGFAIDVTLSFICPSLQVPLTQPSIAAIHQSPQECVKYHSVKLLNENPSFTDQ